MFWYIVDSRDQGNQVEIFLSGLLRRIIPNVFWARAFLYQIWWRHASQYGFPSQIYRSD
jgi:hypothetical protein